MAQPVHRVIARICRWWKLAAVRQPAIMDDAIPSWQRSPGLKLRSSFVRNTRATRFHYFPSALCCLSISIHSSAVPLGFASCQCSANVLYLWPHRTNALVGNATRGDSDAVAALRTFQPQVP